MMKQQRLSTTLHKKSPPSLGNTCGNQLLRHLVSSQMPSLMSQAAILPNSDGDIRDGGERHREDVSKQRTRVLDNIIELVDAEGDRGGGGGGGENRGSSVLMNLLVSGCDVSAGYVCLVKSKSTAKGIGNA